MNLQFINEPRLTFARGEHICPRHGISQYGVFDSRDAGPRRSAIHVGAVGDTASLEALRNWFDRCSQPIPRKEGARQPRLFTGFCGMHLAYGFHAKFVTDSSFERPLRNTDLVRVSQIRIFRERVEAALELYYSEIRFLAEYRQVDLIVCVIPDELHEAIALARSNEEPESLDASLDVTGEVNFRRALKAKTMHMALPLQLIRQSSLRSNPKGQQDDATKAWNFCTALYYKAGPTVPWKVAAVSDRPTSCAVGIAFYRSRDYQNLDTSLAQVFDELGNGLILRGTPVDLKKGDRIPHLSDRQAFELLQRALAEYRIAMKAIPARIVIHKSSVFTPDEIAGFDAGARESRVDTVDYVTILDSKLRLFRSGNYPPYRGVFVNLGRERSLLYTRGSVWFYETYPGMYIPEPVDMRIVRSEETPLFLASEILGLTKMNWNNTQFDGKYPITLGCARKVGEVLKYLSEDQIPQSRYSYYM